MLSLVVALAVFLIGQFFYLALPVHFSLVLYGSLDIRLFRRIFIFF